MRHIIFGTKSQGLSLEISLHIFQILKVTPLQCCIIKDVDPCIFNAKFCVFQSLAVVIQKIFIKQKITGSFKSGNEK